MRSLPPGLRLAESLGLLAALPAGPTLALVAGLLAGIVVLNLAAGWLVFRWSRRDLRPGLGSEVA